MNENHEGGSRSAFADTHRAAPQAAVAGPCVRHEEPFGLPGLLRAQYEQTPDAVACADAGRVLTYRDLELLSDAAAELLARTAPGTGRVLLLLRRGVDVLVAMLGVLKAGCSYIPVDIDEPESRLASIVAQAQPVAVFAERDIIPATLGDLPRLNVPRETGDRGDPAPLRPVPVNQPVYIMFTSGSTGEPKGVILGSEALVNRLLWMQRQYGLTAADRILQKTPYTFDVSGWELFWPLLVGARCVFAPHGAHRDPVMLAALLAEHEITVCHFVPSMLAEFLRALAAADAISLRHVFCSGEALPARIARHCLAILPAQLHNLYGPTEAAIDVTYWPVPRDLAETDEVLIGAPIANTRLYVLDEERCPVPEGEVGELWIGGQPVALGYVGREDLTALAFAAIGGDRCYRTGDLVRQAGDALGYLGRADEQVKVRGVRVEPLEVEHVLDACPGVGQAVVTAVRGTGGDSQLVAVLRAQPAPCGRPDEAEIRRHLAEQLPPAFMPAALYWVDHVPLNRSGKTDRPGIRAQMQSWWDSKTSAPEDSDPIRAAWLAAMDRPADGVPEHEGYLTAGGQSLSAVRLVATVRERFGVAVPLSLLLDSDISLSGLRDYVSAAPRAAHAQNGPNEPGSGLGPEPAAGGRTPASAGVAYTGRSPLAPEQRRLWMLSRLYPGSPAYNVTIVLKFRGALVASALERALAALAGQHDMLRARVSEDAVGRPWLRYEREARFELEVEQTSKPLRPEHVESFVRVAAAEVVPDDRAPMARARLLCSTTGPESSLVLVFNHLVADQQATDLLVRELAASYSAFVVGEAPEVRPAGRYASYALRAERWAAGNGWVRDLAHWRRRLDGIPPELSLPFRRKRSDASHDFRGASATAELDAVLCERLDRHLRTHRVTRAGFFLGVFGAVLGEWSGQQDLVIGVPSSRRRVAADQDLIGFLVDTLPVRLQLDQCATFADLLGHARHRHSEALDHAAPTFDALVSELKPAYRPHRNPIFQVWLNDLSSGGQVDGFAGLEVEPELPPIHSSLFDLGLYIHRRGHTLALQLVSAADLYDGWVGAELLAQCVSVVRQVLDDPAVPLGDLDLVSQEAAPGLAATARVLPSAGPRRDILDLVAGATTRHAGSEAIVSPGRTMTYAELDAAVARVASGLQADGVRPGDLVEVRASRSAGLPIAMLGCWRSGAAAGLVDAAMPAARLADCGRLLQARLALVADDDALTVASEPWPPPGEPSGTRSASNSAPDPAPDRPGTDLSHVLFTSGTTGTPEAVRVPHGPLRDFIGWYADSFGIGPQDRFALLSGSAHDPVLRDMFVPLSVGATLHVPPPSDDPARLRDWLASNAITVLHATPGLLALILAITGPPLPDLRLLVVGGAPLTHGLARAARAVCPATIISAYGSTETPQIVACHRVDDADLAAGPDDAMVSIGTGVASHDVTVRTHDGRLAGIGQRGELVVRSHNLAAGYLGRSLATTFGTDPTTGEPVYRTGDLGRMDAGGCIHVDGRRDRQVLVGGYRVELDEVEAIALRHTDVRHSMAALADTDFGPVLTLDVDPRPGGALTVGALRSHLRSLLSAPAVPSAIRLVDGFVLGPNQKLLPGAPVVDSTPPASPGLADGPTIGWLRRRLGDLVDHPMGDDENFFEAGLNSLLLLLLHADLARELDRPFPVTALFAHPTLRALADFLDGSTQERVAAAWSVRTADPGMLRHEGQVRRNLRRRLRDQH